MSPFISPELINQLPTGDLPRSYDYYPIDLSWRASVEPVVSPNKTTEPDRYSDVSNQQPEMANQIAFPSDMSEQGRGWLLDYADDLIAAKETNTVLYEHDSTTGSYCGRMSHGEKSQAAFLKSLSIEGRLGVTETVVTIAAITPDQRINKFVSQHPYMAVVFGLPEAPLQDQGTQSDTEVAASEVATHESALQDVADWAIGGAMREEYNDPARAKENADVSLVADEPRALYLVGAMSAA